MKIYLFVLSILLLSSITSSAQFFKTGVVAGISGAQIEGDGYGGYHKLGFIAGGFVNTDLSKKVSTQFEIYFINKGSYKAPRPDKGDHDQLSINLNYIEIPLSIRYKHNKFMFEGGLYLSKLLSYRVEIDFAERTVTQYPFRSFDFGAFIGAYYQLNDHFMLNLRSKNSIIPIRDFQNLDQNVGILNKLFNRGWYNVDLNLSLRYEFGN